jgi:hypothetical protein
LKLSRSFSLLGFVTLTGLFTVSRGPAQVAKPTEYQVKAAYLSNFGRFVEWPAAALAQAENAFPICVLGEDPMGASLDAALAGETIDRLPLVARRIGKVGEAAGCRILYVGASEESSLPAIVKALEKTSVLTVSDIPQFTTRGGMIEFAVNNNRVRFEVNLAAARRAGLTLSSELLKLAVAVRRGP